MYARVLNHKIAIFVFIIASQWRLESPGLLTRGFILNTDAPKKQVKDYVILTQI